MGRNRMDPDTALEFSLNATEARLHHEAPAPTETSPSSARSLTDTPTCLPSLRPGTSAATLASSGMSHLATVTIAGYLVQSGADAEVIAAE